MENRNRTRTTGSTGSGTGGSSGTRGRAGYDQDENARVADTSPGDIRTGAEATAGAVGGPHTDFTAAERGAAGLGEIPGMEGRMRRSGAGTERTMARGAYGRGGRESEDFGMDQMSRMIRESHEEGDPEMQMREEDLHARQQNLGERENALRDREDQLRTREQNLRERQARVTGKGMGATDYQDYRVRNDR